MRVWSSYQWTFVIVMALNWPAEEVETWGMPLHVTHKLLLKCSCGFNLVINEGHSLPNYRIIARFPLESPSSLGAHNSLCFNNLNLPEPGSNQTELYNHFEGITVALQWKSLRTKSWSWCHSCAVPTDWLAPALQQSHSLSRGWLWSPWLRCHQSSA